MTGTKNRPQHVVPYSEAHCELAEAAGVTHPYGLNQSFGYATYRLEGPNGDVWRYADTGEPVDDETRAVRKCPGCDLLPRPDGIDPCMGALPGIYSACCGHGMTDEGWLSFNNDARLRVDDQKPPLAQLVAIIRQLRTRAREMPMTPRNLRLLEQRCVESLLGRGLTRDDIEVRIAARR